MTRRRGLTWAFAGLLGLAALITIWAVLAEPAPPSLRPTSLADMVLVESDDFGIPLRFGLEPFYIDRFEVTEGAWQDYVAATGAVDPMEGLEEESRSRDFPMRYVTLDQAEAFARWHLKTLPSNYQWEVAMSGPGGSPMPWGAGFLYAANSNEAWEQRGFVGRGVTHVGTFAKGRSAVGCYDMIGNVWEWTSSLYYEALRDRRYRTSPDRDRDEEELLRALDVFQGWPEPYVLPPQHRYLSSSNELDPIEDEGPGLIEYLFALTPQEEFELRKFVATGDQQYVLAAFDSEEVGIEDIVEDPLLFEPIDPRLLFVMTDADAVIITDNYAEEIDQSQYILPTRTYLDAIERELLTPSTKLTRRSEDGAPLWSLYPLDVVSSEDAERIENEKRRIANRIDLIEDWAERYPLFLLARSNLESGERERIIRGGSFLTSIRAKDEALERLENAESASWELGFRCVVTRAELERQLRILPLIEDLGWRDPYHWFQRVRPARRELVRTGPEALPYLEQARDRCRLSWLRERLSGLIDEIRRKT